MIHRLTDHLRAHWSAIVGDSLPEPSAIHLMKFGTVVDFPRKYVYLYAFLDGDREPSLVLKITADRAAQAQLVREYDLLNRIRARVTEEIAASIPAALAGLPFGRYWVGVEEAAGGRRFLPFIDLRRPPERRRVEPYLDRVTSWLIAFGRCGGGRQEFDGELYRQAAVEPIARLRSYYDLDGTELTYLEELTRRLEEHRGRPVMAVASHGDLWPGNIYVHQGRLRIIDWPDFRLLDASYHDLWNFIDSLVLRRGSARERLDVGGRDPAAHALFGVPERGRWFDRLVRGMVERYVHTLELDAELVRLMLPMYYVTMATRREPVNESSVAINHKFRGLLAAYVRLATQGGRFGLPGPWGPSTGGGRIDPDPDGEETGGDEAAGRRIAESVPNDG
ncbi:MAG: phosphotransferase [Candidatus Eiseniibacteriota bacterium]